MAKVMICDVCGDVVRERKAVVTLAYERGLKREWDLCDGCTRRVADVLRKAEALEECGTEGRGFAAGAQAEQSEAWGRENPRAAWNRQPPVFAEGKMVGGFERGAPGTRSALGGARNSREVGKTEGRSAQQTPRALLRGEAANGDKGEV